MGFLQQVTRKQATLSRDGSWQHFMEKSVLQRAGTQSLQTYVDRGQATVPEWVDLRPMFDVVQERWVMRDGGDSGCCGGGRRQRRIS